MKQSREVLYEKGLALEKSGKAGQEVAEALGLRSRQDWYSLKSQMKGKALTARAAAQCPPEELPEDPMVAGIMARKEKPQEAPPAKAAARTSALKIKSLIQAQGVATDYRIENGKLGMRKREGAKNTYASYSLVEIAHLIVELGELMRLMEGEPT
ncbi:MAG: hypothetical protein PHH32_03205 [Eubacteriales bacterium]|nr:hypothetical protein [Eubacteriales bacterium]